jgi:spermidine/putrescine-binding protein
MKNEDKSDSIEDDIRFGFIPLAIRPLLFLLLTLLCFNLAACGPKPSESDTDRSLNLFVWSDYIPNKTLNDFEKTTGIRVHYDTFDSNEAMLEKLQSGVSEYDVIVPSDFMVGTLRNQNLLDKLDPKRIPNLKNIGKRFLNLSYDPLNENTVPFLWSTTGIAYNKTKIKEPVDSWGILWNEKYKDRILMLDDMRECFGGVLKWKGFSLNSTNPAELLEAKNLLLQQKPLVKMYNSTSFDEALLGGDVWLAHGWSGNFARVIQQNHDLAYVIPKEGGAIAVENFVIPKGAAHVEEAYAFINYCLEPKVGAEITNMSGYPNANEAAKAYIKPEILNDPVIYPDERTLARCELMKDLGPTTEILDRYWTEIKSK